MQTVRLGMMGAGKMGHWAAERIQTHPDAVLSALFDTHPGRLAELADAFAIRHRFTEAEAFCACDELDAIYIALPNVFHAPMAKMALRAGKDVLLEKPFAMSHAEAQEIVDVAQACGRKLMIGMDQRYTEDSQRIVSLAREGAFGELYYGKAYWFRRAGIPRMGTWFGHRALAGAGAINDIGVHMLDLCLHVMDNFDPVSVSGQTFTKFGSRGEGEGKWGLSDREGLAFDVDDFAAALIKFRNGAAVTLEVAWAAHMGEAHRNNVEVFGTEGGASCRPALWHRKNPLSGEHETLTDPPGTISMPHAEKFHNFINVLLGREPMCVTLGEALAVQKILDAVTESCVTGREVRFDEPAGPR